MPWSSTRLGQSQTLGSLSSKKRQISLDPQPNHLSSPLVHELHPAHIKVVAALGDSLTVSTETGTLKPSHSVQNQLGSQKGSLHTAHTATVHTLPSTFSSPVQTSRLLNLPLQPQGK